MNTNRNPIEKEVLRLYVLLQSQHTLHLRNCPLKMAEEPDRIHIQLELSRLGDSVVEQKIKKLVMQDQNLKSLQEKDYKFKFSLDKQRFHACIDEINNS